MLRLPKFEYFKPNTVKEACIFLMENKGKARALAGGTDLLAKMKRREVAFRHLVSLSGISDLDYITYDTGDGLRIGALTTFKSLEDSLLIKDKFGIIAQAANTMASTQVRNIGTVGGNICNASPAADLVPPLMVLGAKVRIAGPDKERLISLEDFFRGPGMTVLEDGEVLTEIQVPPPLPHSGGTYLKISIRKKDLAVVGAGVLITIDSPDGVCKGAKIALGAVAPTSIRAKKAEGVLEGKTLKEDLIEEASRVASTEAAPISDLRSSSEYRQEMIKVLVKRGINSSLKVAKSI